MEETKHKELRHSAVNRMGAGQGDEQIEKRRMISRAGQGRGRVQNERREEREVTAGASRAVTEKETHRTEGRECD
jgi:hypothetical protein